MRVLLATSNKHKAAEFAEIFAGHEVVTPAHLGLTLDVEETGTTFLENALLKARALRGLLGDESERPADGVPPVIVADDSGICVTALGGAPGVYSARYGSPDGGATELDASARNELLLHSIRGAEDRSASFVCCMVGLLPGDRFVVAQESWRGEIVEQEVKGAGGFGYDPVFLLRDRGVTAAELPPEEKNRLSHRGRASRVLAAALEAAWGLPG